MAKLLVEVFDSTETLIEEVNGEKNYYIQGIFMQAEQTNKNGRIYRKPHMEREVNKYIQESINKNKSLGELQHPANRVNVDPERAAHRILNLNLEGNDVYGKSKILTKWPCGQTVKNLIDEGISFGVSSRALGSLKRLPNGVNEVQSDFDLRCVDIVSDPSGPGCWVNAVMENTEWVMVEGEWTEQFHEQTKKIIRKASKKELQETIERRFNEFMLML